MTFFLKRTIAGLSEILPPSSSIPIEDLAPGDYHDPGWYKHPQGTVAYEVDAAGAPKAQKSGSSESPGMNGMKMPGMEMPGMDMPGMKHGGPHQH